MLLKLFFAIVQNLGTFIMLHNTETRLSVGPRPPTQTEGKAFFEQKIMKLMPSYENLS
jgi:hypothetical protein